MNGRISYTFVWNEYFNLLLGIFNAISINQPYYLFPSMAFDIYGR